MNRSLFCVAACLSVLTRLAGSSLGDERIPKTWVRPPSAAAMKATPGLKHFTYESTAMKATVGYSVVLPPGYEQSRQRYPVVYWLHGGGGHESSSLSTAQTWQKLYQTQEVKPVILVYPNGFRSGYMDHFDGAVMAESMIIRELIPLIDRTFRTIASREGRAAHGFSMGASGSLKFAFKYPDLFCSAVAYGGGAINLETDTSPFITNILKRNLDAEPSLIRDNNTYHFLQKNGETVRKNGTQFLLVCGDKDSWKKSAVDFHEVLQKETISSELRLVPSVGHNLGGLIKAEGEAAARFQDRVFLAANRKQASADDKPATITETYFSRAEGRRQKFQVVLPPGFNRETDYPLIVQVFGGSSLLPTRERPFLRVRPSARGVWGYRSMSRYDVMQVIRHMQEQYPIDEDRVYLTGTSAGATGAMHVAAQRPDVFAGVVPLVAFGNDLPLENFCNLPLRCEHGVNDWTSAIGNVRVQFQKLKKLGYDAVLHEHPRAGHGISVPPRETLDWLFSQRRNPRPERIVYSCEHPRDGRAYWLRIERFVDPHAIARIEVVAHEDSIQVTTTNVRRFSLDLTTAPLKSGQRLNINGQRVEFLIDPEQKSLVFTAEPEWQERAEDQAKPERAIYGSGAAANLFQGDPLLVVYGTEGSESENRFLKRLAESLARSGGPHFKPAAVQFPVRPDSDLSDFNLNDVNLLLVGTTASNSLLKRMAASLPYTVSDRVLSAAGRKPLPLDGAVLSCHYFNPEHPGRLIYVVSPFLSAEEEALCLKNPRKFLAGSDGFKMIDQPDLLVRGADLRIRREMQFDADWQFIRFDGEDQLIDKGFADREHFARAHLQVMQKSADVDFALWWGPEDKGLFGGYDFNWLQEFDPSSYTLADYAVRRRETETMTGQLPGDELLDIFDRWIATRELITWPEFRRSDIDAKRVYRIAIPMDLVPKLGIRRKTLSAVAVGPDIFPSQVLP